MHEHSRQVQETTNQISNNTNIINNSNQPSATFGDIHVVCPGITEQQAAEKLPGVLNMI